MNWNYYNSYHIRVILIQAKYDLNIPLELLSGLNQGIMSV